MKRSPLRIAICVNLAAFVWLFACKEKQLPLPAAPHHVPGMKGDVTLAEIVNCSGVLLNIARPDHIKGAAIQKAMFEYLWIRSYQTGSTRVRGIPFYLNGIRREPIEPIGRPYELSDFAKSTLSDIGCFDLHTDSDCDAVTIQDINCFLAVAVSFLEDKSYWKSGHFEGPWRVVLQTGVARMLLTLNELDAAANEDRLLPTAWKVIPNDVQGGIREVAVGLRDSDEQLFRTIFGEHQELYVATCGPLTETALTSTDLKTKYGRLVALMDQIK